MRNKNIKKITDLAGMKKTQMNISNYAFITLLFLLSGIANTKLLGQQPKEDCWNYLDYVIAHYDKQLSKGLDVYGKDTTAFWMASLSTYTGLYPEDATRPPHIPQRAYLDRYVDAPKGATLYWDMPSIAAAYALSRQTSNLKYKEAANAYIQDFLANCVAKNGVFLWGNHYYYDTFLDTIMKFGSQPVPVDFTTEKGDLHEIRPLAPAWEAIWQIDAEATEQEILTSAQQHVSDATTGEFNRHADGERGHAFIEAGGMLVYNLAWLYNKTNNKVLLEQADKIATFSYEHRHATTGLLTNDPTSNRWDNYTSTTEVGLWAGCLLAAAEMADQAHAKKWQNMADNVLTSWLSLGYDPTAEQYFGMLHMETGKPIFREEGDDYPYKPGDYSNIWEPLFPTHNYPMTMAESCLKLYQLTQKEMYRQACERWVAVIETSLPARQGQGAYAEHYGRVIYFLLSCSDTLQDDKYKDLSDKIAKEAVDVLFAHDMFRSHPGEYRYDAVDGMGILSLALIWLETGQKPDMMGLFF